MSYKRDTKKLGDILIEIGQKINQDPSFIGQLDKFVNSSTKTDKDSIINFEKINSIDLFNLIREKTEKEVEDTLSEFNIKELREILKKYRFGSPSTLRTNVQLKKYILNQLNQRKTDVFRNTNEII